MVALNKIYKTRVLNIQNKLTQSNIKVAIVTDSDNVFYFSGRIKYEGSSDAILVIPDKGEPSLIIHKEESKFRVIKRFQGKVYLYDEDNTILDVFMKIYGKKIFNVLIGFEKYSIQLSIVNSFGIFKELNLKNISGYIEELRSIKDRHEIELIRNSVLISLKGQKKAKEIFSPGIHEIILQSKCKQEMEVSAGKFIEIKSDILFGEKTALIGSPVGTADRNVAKISDMAIIDLLPRVNGYYGDTTRTLWLDKLSKYKKDLIGFVEKVKKEVETKLKPGISCEELDYIARSKLCKEGFFPHHTGHGIGISNYELPYIVSDAKYILKEGMTITLEPGIYFDDWGARIEDDYLIVKGGFIKLSR